MAILYLTILLIKFNVFYLQSVTNNLSLGGEVFWAGQHRKSGIGFAGRYNTDKMVYIMFKLGTGTFAFFILMYSCHA